MNGLVSIILPVYNSKKTLSKCIHSIISQSYRDWELMVVLDGIGGGQEECRRMIESYQKKDTRIHYIEQENAGVDSARFVGMNATDGEFIMFIDADDWLEPEALQCTTKVIKESNYDYVDATFIRCLGPIKKTSKQCLFGAIELPDLFKDYYISFFGKSLLSVSMCGKLYRRETIERAGLFPSGFSMGEDLVFNMKLFPFLHKIYLIDKPYYNYRYGGMTSRYNPHLLNDLKSQFLLKLQAIEEYSYHKADNSARIEMVNVLHSEIKQRLIFHGNQTKGEVIDSINKEISDPFWAEVLNITSDYLDNSPFYIALKNRDADALYAICKNEVDSTKIQRVCKRVASRILSII